jgi:hypothetical protein
VTDTSVVEEGRSSRAYLDLTLAGARQQGLPEECMRPFADTDTTLVEFAEGPPVEVREFDENICLDLGAEGHAVNRSTPLRASRPRSSSSAD